MKQSVLEYKKLLEQEGLLVEFAEPEGKEGEDRPVTLVTYFSGGADQGTLFLCKGAAFKEAYLKDAVNRGAVAYVSEKKYEAGKEIPALIVNDARKAQFVLGEAFYDYPAKSLHVTALTGTKGKTTTAYYLQSMLDACLKKQGGNGCALLSSIEYYDGKTREASTLTTPESLELCRHMRNAVDAGLSHMVMEVSSQALKYERVGNTHFDTAVFRNNGSFVFYFFRRLCNKSRILRDDSYTIRFLDFFRRSFPSEFSTINFQSSPGYDIIIL